MIIPLYKVRLSHNISSQVAYGIPTEYIVHFQYLLSRAAPFFAWRKCLQLNVSPHGCIHLSGLKQPKLALVWLH